MTYGSVCSGIEAASVAWKPLGWRCAFVSEIEPFPKRVLAHHYPDVPDLGDFTKIGADRGPVDLLVGGTPCQSFSVAGLRQGLDDPRGNLMLEFGALARRIRARWLVWENVPGVLSSNGGRDFAAFLGMLGELGYGFAYRVLDAQYFGVAQRRRRVFVVGHAGGLWQRAAAVLFEPESLRGDPAPRREARGGVANALTERPDRGGGNSEGQRLIAGTLGNRLGRSRTELDGHGAYVTHALTGEGFDASEDGTGRGTPLVAAVAPCLQSACNDYSRADGFVAIPFDTTQITSAANYSRPAPGDACHPIAAGAHPPAIAFSITPEGGQGEDLRATEVNVAPALGSKNEGVPGYDRGVRIVDLQNTRVGKDVAGALDTSRPSRGGGQAVLSPALTTNDPSRSPQAREVTAQVEAVHSSSMAVRRLTPVECARLQGFPDDYLDIPGAKDGPKYRALGNSMAVPVMAWIGKRIDVVDKEGR